jgi:hypothetical protein
VKNITLKTTPERPEPALPQRLYEVERSLGARLYAIERELAAIANRPVPPQPPESRPLDLSVGDTRDAVRWGNLVRSLDELYLQVVLAPGYHGEGPAIGATVEFRYWILLPGALTPVHSHRPLRALWPRTRARITVWVWTDGGVPGTFGLRLNIAQTAGGVGVGAPAYPVFNHDFSVAPTVANQTQKFTSIVPAGSILNASPGELVKFYVARKNDGNGNNLYLQCALIELLEAA